MKIAILGAGNMGRVHASAYKKLSGVEISAVVGRDVAKTEQLASDYDAKAFTDPSEIIRDKSIDAIDICLPTSLHKKYVLGVLESGKHVFCETPISFNPEDAEAMIRASKSGDSVFMIALLLRFVPDRVYFKKIVDSGKLGELTSISISKICPPYWPKGGSLKDTHYANSVIELMTFEFDFLNWLLGMPKKLFAFGRVGETKTYEHVFCSLGYDDLVVSVESNTIVSRDFNLTTIVKATFEKGFIENVTRIMEDDFPESKTVLYQNNEKEEIIELKGVNPYDKECEYFVDAITGKADPSFLSGENALNALKVSLATIESLNGEKVIRIK